MTKNDTLCLAEWHCYSEARVGHRIRLAYSPVTKRHNVEHHLNLDGDEASRLARPEAVRRFLSWFSQRNFLPVVRMSYDILSSIFEPEGLTVVDMFKFPCHEKIEWSSESLITCYWSRINALFPS